MRTFMRIGSASLAAVLVLLGAAGTSHAADRAALVGRVIDHGGEGIADATIYIRRVEGSHSTPCEDRHFGHQTANGLFVVKTGTQGRFTADLPGGSYEVAAFKPGYNFTLTAVNTQARGIIDLSLERSPGIVLGDLPVGSAGQNLGLNWILRRSPNGVLREVDATGGLADLSSGEGDEAGGILPAPSVNRPLAASATGQQNWFGTMARSFDGRFVHRFSGGEPFGSSSAGVGDTAGRETSLALSGDLRGRGSWRILGRAGKNSADFDRVSSLRRDRQMERFSAGFDFRLGDLDDLTAGIEYGTSRYRVASTGEAGHFTEQEQRTFGFHSRWDRSLGRNARLFVDGVFHQAGLSAPASTITPASIEAHGIDGAVDRAWQAGAGVALSSGTHNLGFGIRTRNYRHDLRDRRILLYGSPRESLNEGGVRGSGMSLYAADDWRIAERVVLNYGVGYHGSFTEDAGYIVPRVGFTHDLGGDGRTIVRSMVMLRVDQPGSRPGEGFVDGDRSNRDEPGRVGYLIGVERRPDKRLQIAATYRYEPYRDPGAERAGSPHTDWAIYGENGLFLSDGAAAHHELDIELARAFGPVRGILSGSVGRVRGLVTPTLEAAPIQILSNGEMRYYDTRLSAAYGPSETEVQIGYRSISADTSDEPSAGGGDYRLIDLVVYQELPWLSRIGNARWQVLMAYQGLDYGSLYDGSGGSEGGTTSRISGGVDIRF